MKNIVTATIYFSFKGKNYSPSITLELDKYLAATGSLPDLYPLIANENNFDLYSYEYEVMQSVDIHFSQPQGLIADFITNGQLDHDAFQAAWQKQRIESRLLDIAKRHMNINDFTTQPQLKNALLDAYQQGKQDRH